MSEAALSRGVEDTSIGRVERREKNVEYGAQGGAGRTANHAGRYRAKVKRVKKKRGNKRIMDGKGEALGKTLIERRGESIPAEKRPGGAQNSREG